MQRRLLNCPKLDGVSRSFRYFILRLDPYAAIINVWRPLSVCRRDPLAYCDARTVDEEDYMPVVSYLPASFLAKGSNSTGGQRFEQYYKKWNAQDKWYYCSDMAPGECLLLKIFDSSTDDSVARRCPHSAFELPGTEDQPTRETIEIKCLAFWET